MRIIFFGTGKFSADILNGMLDNGLNVVAVVSQPDKVNGRNNKISYSQIKQTCLNRQIPLFQFEKLNIQGEEILKDLNPDVFVTASYGQIIRQNILDIPKFTTINVHASLLPKYRGPAPIQWAIMKGEKKTGITIMQTELGVDTGNMYFQKELDILPEDTATSLFDKLAILGVECVIEFFKNFDKYINNSVKQDENKASYFPMIKKEDYLLNFNDCAYNIYNKVRALENCYFIYKNVRYKVLFAVPNDKTGKVGEILECSSKLGFIIGCLDRSVEIITIQPEGKQKLFATAYMNSNKFTKGDIIENS